MDPARLKIKEQVEAEVRKDMNKIVDDTEGEPTGPSKPVETQEKMRPREIPMFMIYFQIYDNVTKSSIVEFEDFSTSRVKSAMVKKEAKDVLQRIIASKQEKDVTLSSPSGFENHNWTYSVTKKNWIFMRWLISFLQ